MDNEYCLEAKLLAYIKRELGGYRLERCQSSEFLHEDGVVKVDFWIYTYFNREQIFAKINEIVKYFNGSIALYSTSFSEEYTESSDGFRLIACFQMVIIDEDKEALHGLVRMITGGVS